MEWTAGRFDTSGSFLALGVDGVETAWLVGTDSGYARWTTDPAEFGFFLEVDDGSEIVTVTWVEGPDSPQAFTVTRGSFATTPQSWPSGTRLRVLEAAIL